MVGTRSRVPNETGVLVAHRVLLAGHGVSAVGEGLLDRADQLDVGHGSVVRAHRRTGGNAGEFVQADQVRGGVAEHGLGARTVDCEWCHGGSSCGGFRGGLVGRATGKARGSAAPEPSSTQYRVLSTQY